MYAPAFSTSPTRSPRTGLPLCGASRVQVDTMIVDLPSLEMTMAGGMADIACEDLFISVVDEDEDIEDERNRGFGRKDRVGALSRGNSSSPGSCSGGFLRAPMEMFVYSSTSASESELEPGDVLMSDIDTDAEQFIVPVRITDHSEQATAVPDSPSALTEVRNRQYV